MSLETLYLPHNLSCRHFSPIIKKNNLSEALRKRTIFFYDLKENYRTSWNVRKINNNKNDLL